MSRARLLRQSAQALILLAIAFPALALAQDSVPAQPQTLPSTTNPAERVIYAGEGQTVEQQQADQLACYNYAGEQTDWDPEAAYDALERDYGDAMAQYKATQGGAVRGGARGALVGLAIGAIAGDAGQGAAIGAVAGGARGGIRARRGRQAAESDFDKAVAAFTEKFQLWDRNWVACMEGKKYGVS